MIFQQLMVSPILFQMRWKYRKILLKATENYLFQMFTLIFLHFHSGLQYFKAFIPECNNTRTSSSPVLSFHLKQKYTTIIFEHKLCCYEGQRIHTKEKEGRQREWEQKRGNLIQDWYPTLPYRLFFFNLNFKYYKLSSV